ncbi:MAG TPA: YceI family protein [Anaerolineae bacterium]|jgi:polyisoprenoid-binding protein YceI
MSWVLDKAHSQVAFTIKHLMFSTVHGKFTDFDATFGLNEKDLSLSSVQGVVKTASIDTGDEKRDGHLRSADFFDAEKYPTFTFKSTKVEAKGGNKYHVTGELTIKDVTKPVVFEATEEGKGKSPWGSEIWAFSAELGLNRKDFGLNWNVALETGGWLVGDAVKVGLDLEIVKQPDTVAASS